MPIRFNFTTILIPVNLIIALVMRNFLIVISLFISSYSFSQSNPDGHYIVGILPARISDNSAIYYRENFQSLVSNVFVEKSRFTVVDRTRFSQVVEEKQIQKNEDFINGTVVAQGKSLGAQFLIYANLSQLGLSGRNVQKVNLLTGKQYITHEIYVTLGAEVQIIDVETGSVKSNKLFNNITTSETTSDQAAISDAFLSLGKFMRAWVNEAFPVYMKVVSVESVDKKGLPQTILIKGGEDMNLQHSGLLFNTSSELSVFINNKIVIDGKEYMRPMILGKVKISEVQGELSVCKVKNGAEAIQKALNEGKVLLLKISSY